jgi:hypothetical protein
VEYVQEHLHKLGPWEIINAGNDHSAQNDQNGKFLAPDNVSKSTAFGCFS